MVKVLFDSSVLIAAFVPDHPSHEACFVWFEQVRANEIEGVIATRTIAECFNVLSTLPRRPRLSPQQVQLLLQNLQLFTIVPLTDEDYWSAIALMVASGRSGGGIYDALIAQVALKAEVAILLTLNAKDFTRLGEEIARLVQVPT